MNMHERLTSWALSGGVAHFWLWSGWWGGTGLGGGCGWGRWWVGSSLHWVGWLHGNATLPRSIALVATGQTDVALVTPLVSPAHMVTCISSKAEHHIMLLTYMLVSMSMPLHEYQCMQSYQNLGGSCHAFNNTCAGHSVLCALQGLCVLVLTPEVYKPCRAQTTLCPAHVLLKAWHDYKSMQNGHCLCPGYVTMLEATSCCLGSLLLSSLQFGNFSFLYSLPLLKNDNLQLEHAGRRLTQPHQEFLTIQ